jgi:hypothetical protein
MSLPNKALADVFLPGGEPVSQDHCLDAAAQS